VPAIHRSAANADPAEVNPRRLQRDATDHGGRIQDDLLPARQRRAAPSDHLAQG